MPKATSHDMEKQQYNVRLMRSTIRNGLTEFLAVGICSAVLFLFVALTYSRITLPRYTVQYDQKDTQQVVNLLITVVATVIGILLTHCRRLTNEAETRSELRNDELTIPRLHIHYQAAGGSKATMSLPSRHNKQLWRLILVYLFTIIIFGFLHSVLSVIFVVEAVISDKGDAVPVHIPTVIDFDGVYEGKVVDPCSNQILAPGCAYDLALPSMASELVTVTSYQVGDVVFEPGNGTMGLPYYVMDHFSNQVRHSQFEEEYRQYCVPVLEPRQIWCEEEPFNQTARRTITNLVEYKEHGIYEKTGPKIDSFKNSGVAIFKITAPYPGSGEGDQIKWRINDQGQGTFFTHMFSTDDPVPGHEYTSVIGATDNDLFSGGYASLLYRMMYDKDPDLSDVPSGGQFTFVATCHLSHLTKQNDSLSNWKLVDFTMRNGVLRTNITDQTCPNPKGPEVSGFADLPFFLEGVGSVISAPDGYVNLFNDNIEEGVVHAGSGSTVFAGMSRLDATVNKICQLVLTGWTQEAHNYSMKSPGVYDKPLIMLNYPHLYIIRINWTPTTYIGLVLSILITLNAYILFGRWIRAVYQFGFEKETWNLLRPVDLMAYSLAAWHDLIHDLRTVDQRRAAVHGGTSILQENPGGKQVQNSGSLVSTVVAHSPSDTSNGRGTFPAEEGLPKPMPMIQTTVQTTETDLERGVRYSA